MSGFLDVSQLLVPQNVIQEGQRFLRNTGATGREGIVLWVGRKEGTIFVVSELIVPEQRGIRTMGGVCVIIEGTVLARLNADLYKKQLQLIAQVHSHPGEAYHSAMDDEYAIATKIGSLSLVVPDFATRPFSLSECAAYRLKTNGKWAALSTRKTKKTICITDVGGDYGAS
jgi:hypothetical protein